MDTQNSNLNQAIIDYYEGTRVEYRLLWRNRHNLGLHFGYYDNSHTTHDQAVLNLNAQMAMQAGVTKNDTVLDAGCGVGGSAIWLAQNLQCKATGINITPRQISRAIDNAANRNATPLTRFIVADFSKLPFDTDTFTVFWGIESIVHAADKQIVLNQAYRVLKPGGRLIIAEYLLPERKLTVTETKLLHTWLNGWSMPQLETVESYTHMLEEASFNHIAIHDWTEHMMPSFSRLRSYSRKFRLVEPLLSALRLANSNQRRNLKATEAQMLLLESGAWHYQVVTAIK